VSECGSSIHNLPVYPAEDKVKDSLAFIIIANLSVNVFAAQMCLRYGRVNMVSYLTHYQISRPEAAIDVAGMCNIQCPSCPRGNMELVRPEGCMPLDTYRSVFDKLIREIPNLVHLELYTWGEPLLNPELPEIIKYTEAHLGCTVSTNLLCTDSIAAVVQANPSQLHITVNGYGPAYERNMRGAKWDLLIANLHELATQRNKYQCSSKIRIFLYNYESNSAGYVFMHDFANSLGIELLRGHEYLNPYEHYLDYCMGKEQSVLVKNELLHSAWNVDELLDLALQDREKPCLCQRIFPIINWDTSVSLCHTYQGPVIAKSFLDLSWDELLYERHRAEQCRNCQAYGLHRLDMDILKKRGLLV